MNVGLKLTGFALLRVHLLMLLIMGVFRLWFAVDYLSSEAPGIDVFAAFILGMRFDLVVLAYLQAPLSLALLLVSVFRTSGGPRKYLNFSSHYLFIGFVLLGLICGIDHAYYSYFQDHLNVFAFGFIEDHTTGVLDMIWGMFPIVRIILISSLLSWLFHKGVRVALRPSRAPTDWPARPYSLGFSLLVLVLTAVAARGSLGHFPLRARMASVSSDQSVNQCVLNGPFALKEAIKVRNTESGAGNILQASEFLNVDQAFSYLLGKELVVENMQHALAQLTPAPGSITRGGADQAHVVVLVMESIGSFVFNLDAPDFPVLGSFVDYLPRGVLFDRALPTTNSTIGTVCTLAAGLPHLPGGAYLSQGRFSRIEMPLAPARQFLAHGYGTNFLYGGNTTWRKLDQWLPLQGFQRVEGRKEIMSSLDLDSDQEAHFKVFDHHLFEYLRRRLEEATTPQMFLVLTATNHPPFDPPEFGSTNELVVPSRLAQSLDGGGVAAGRLNAYRYSMECVGDWLSKLESSGLLERTAVVLTGDHNTMDIRSFSGSDLLDQYGVPLWFFLPGQGHESLPEVLPTPAGHLNIYPTLMHALGISDGFPSLERSLLEQSTDAMAINAGRLVISNHGAFESGKFGDKFLQWEEKDSRTLCMSDDQSTEKAEMKRSLQARMVIAEYLIGMAKPQ